MEGEREAKLMIVENNEIDLVGLIKIVYSGRKVVAVLTILGTLLGFGLGYLNDRSTKKSYTASIEFLYKPEKIESSEDIKVYAFEIYVLNSLLKKDGIITNTGGYEIPTITLGDNSIRFSQKDRYSYRIYASENVERDAKLKAKSSYDDFLEEAILLDYSKGDFYKLREKIEVMEPPQKKTSFLILGLFLGSSFGIISVFFKRILTYLKEEIK